MDKYFLKKTKQVKTAIFLTDEEINKIKQLPDITQIIRQVMKIATSAKITILKFATC